MGHYLLNFILTTLGMVVLLYSIYLYIKKNPHFGGLGNLKPMSPNNSLKVYSVLNVELRKSLYVVGYKGQRFMVGTTMEKIELLATLESEPYSEPAVETGSYSAMHEENNSMPLSPSSGFMERFQYSLKTVFANRFGSLGGK